jgi:hypothetical protein
MTDPEWSLHPQLAAGTMLVGLVATFPLTAEIGVVSLALKKLTRCDKINIAAIGNVGNFSFISSRAGKPIRSVVRFAWKQAASRRRPSPTTSSRTEATSPRSGSAGSAAYAPTATIASTGTMPRAHRPALTAPLSDPKHPWNAASS